jgi:hypothetical protein
MFVIHVSHLVQIIHWLLRLNERKCRFLVLEIKLFHISYNINKISTPLVNLHKIPYIESYI